MKVKLFTSGHDFHVGELEHQIQGWLELNTGIEIKAMTQGEAKGKLLIVIIYKDRETQTVGRA